MSGNSIIGGELPSLPIGELVRSMAMAVADAQFELDRSALMVAEFMAGRRPRTDPATGQVLRGADGAPIVDSTLVQFGYALNARGEREPNYVSMLELGFVPNFYQFVDTVIEVKLALRVNAGGQSVDPETGALRADSPGWKSGAVVSAAPVDARYAAGYNFNLELASVFKTKLVCVPPPAGLEERLRELRRLEAQTPPAPDQPA